MQRLAIQEPTPRHVPITVEIYHLMAERGAFGPEDRVELIGGEIFDMSPVGSLHARCVKILNACLSEILRGTHIIGIQDPIVLDDESEPQPDVCVLRYREDFYKHAAPRAADVKLIIEVADSSAAFDRSVKLSRYAMAGIAEAWLIDLSNDRVEVHTQPEQDHYGSVIIYERGDNVVSETIPAIDLSVDGILG